MKITINSKCFFASALFLLVLLFNQYVIDIPILFFLGYYIFKIYKTDFQLCKAHLISTFLLSFSIIDNIKTCNTIVGYYFDGLLYWTVVITFFIFSLYSIFVISSLIYEQIDNCFSKKIANCYFAISVILLFVIKFFNLTLFTFAYNANDLLIFLELRLTKIVLGIFLIIFTNIIFKKRVELLNKINGALYLFVFVVISIIFNSFIYKEVLDEFILNGCIMNMLILVCVTSAVGLMSNHDESLFNWFICGSYLVFTIVSLLCLCVLFFDLKLGIDIQIYGNDIYMNGRNHNMISMFGIITMMLYYVYLQNKNNKRVFGYLSLIINFFFIVIYNSRTSYAVLLIFVGMMPFYRLMQKKRKIITSIFISFVLVLIFVVGRSSVFEIYNHRQNIINLKEVSEQFNKETLENNHNGEISTNTEITTNVTNPINKRDITLNSLTNMGNRVPIWKSSIIKYFSDIKYVLFGVTSTNVANFVEEASTVSAYLHNQILETAIGYGIFSMFAYLYLIYKIVKKHILCIKTKNFIGSLLSFVLLLAIFHNMIESVLLYYSSPYAYVFFVLYGYCMSINTKQSLNNIEKKSTIV